MRLGILSDSHGRHRAVAQAVKLFRQLDVAYLIHCGDVGGQNVFDELVGWPCTFVWGNTDYPENSLFAYLRVVGLNPPDQIPMRLELDGKRIAVYHGHERGFEKACDQLEVDYLFHGHTHVARDESIQGTRIINPGALHRARRKTVAVLDTQTDQLQFHEITENQRGG